VNKKKEKLNQSHFIMMFFAFSFGLILSNLLAQRSASINANPEGVLFVYKGIDKKQQDLSPDAQESLAKLALQKHALLERAALQQHIHQYAQDNQLSIEAAGKEVFEIKPLPEQRVSEFYQENKSKIDKPFYEVEAYIRKQLMLMEAKQVKKGVLNHLIEKGDLAILPGN